MRKPVLWIVVLVVVIVAGAGGYYGWARLGAYSGEQFRTGLDQWIKTLPLSAEDREKLLNGNAKRLLKL